MRVERVVAGGELSRWARGIEAAEWDEGNGDGDAYTATSLARYLEDATNLMLVCHDGGEVLGIASASLRRKPYGDSLWLYVDEVDVAVPHRRKGVGTALMQALLTLARERECDEVWLGAEAGNVPAAALYRSLEGAQEASVLGYTFEL